MTQPIPSEHSNALQTTVPRKALRQQLIQQRKQLPPALRQAWDRQIMAHLLHWCAQRQPCSLAVYWPIQAEPDLRPAYAQLSAMGIQLALPWVVEKGAALQFLAWQVGDAMLADAYGIPLPAQREHIILPTAILIPCVGFNPAAYRLGYGGGFYDRTLAGLPASVALGVAYQCGQAEFAPGEHDIPMQQILTEQGILERSHTA